MNLLAIQVACRGGVIGDAPSDPAVAAEPDARHAWMARASEIVLWPVNGVFVPAGWYPEGLVRIATQDGLARGSAATGDCPVVAAASAVAHAETCIVDRQHGWKRGVRRQYARLGRLWLEESSAQALREQLYRFANRQRVQATVKRPPHTAQDGERVADREWLGLVVKHRELDGQIAAV